jgi:hypothetical protein
VLYVQQENSTQRVQRDIQSILVARGLGEFQHRRVSDSDGDVHEWTTFVPTSERFVTETRLGVLSQASVDLSDAGWRGYLRDLVIEHDYRYLFLDPLYMLIGAVDEKDSAPFKPILNWMKSLQNETGCAPIITHHMSDKSRATNASALLGTTYIHGWYEAALFTASDDDHQTTVQVDALRDMGTARRWSLKGMGVGEWFFIEAAQGQEDSVGRAAPAKEKKETRFAMYEEQHRLHPEWTDADHAEYLNVSDRTIRSYKKRLEGQDND